MNNFLRYGDLIVFYGNGVDISPPAQGEDPNKIKFIESYGGALSAIGFADTGIYYQNFPSDLNGDSFSLGSKLNFSNLKDCVFLVTPKLGFDFHKDFKKTMKYYKSVQRSITGAKAEEKEHLKKVKETLEDKIHKLKERMKKEQVINQNIIKDNVNQVITYGSEIQLMHHDSGYFIKARNDCSQTDNIGYNCELSNWFSGSMVFKIQPKFKSRQEGDVIQLRDHIILNNIKHDAYISMAKELHIYEDFKFGEHVNPYLSKVSVFDRRCKRYRLYLSQEGNCTFQIILYRKNREPLSSELTGGDLVKITHTEIQADLTSTIGFRGPEKEVFMRHYVGEFKDEKTSLNSYWIMEHEVFENAGDRFIIKEKEGGNRLRKSTVRLRHFISGCLMKSKKNENGIDTSYLENDANSNNYLLLDLEPVVKSAGAVLNKQTYFLTSQDQKFLKYSRDEKLSKDKEFLMSRLHKDDPLYQFYPLEDADLNEEKYLSYFSNEFSSEDAYTIEKMDEVSRFSCLFVRSLIPILLDLISVFKVYKIDNITNETYMQVSNTFEKMIVFLFDLGSPDDVDFLEIEEEPLQRRQMILKDFGMIDILVELLYYPFRTGVYDLKLLKKEQPFAKTLELTYTSLRYTIMEYRPNELYASQWISLIMDQSMHTRGHNDIRAGQTLTELIDNNERILENRIEKETIDHFINFLCKEDKDIKFLNILRAICICNDEPIIKNQKEISELMLQQSEVTKELLFLMEKTDREEILVRFNIREYESIELHMLKDKSRSDAHNPLKTFNYFVGLVKLLSDLCKNRNYLAIDILQKKFPFELCFHIMQGSYENEIREVFTSLTMNLWIDVSPFQPIQLPNHIKIWDEVDENDIFKEIQKKDHENYKRLKKFITIHLEKMRSIDNENLEAQSALDLSILELTEKMFILGFFTNLEELNEVVGHLMRYLGASTEKKDKLQFSRNFSKAMYSATMAETISHELGFETEFDEIELKNQKLIECKKKVCEILMFTMKVQNEYRISDFLKNFKEIVKDINSQVTFDTTATIAKIISSKRNGNEVAEADRDKFETSIIERIDKMIEDLMNRQTKVNIDRSTSFISKLLELLLHKNQSLKTSSMGLIQQLHSQNENLKDTILSVQIIDDNTLVKNYEEAKKASTVLNNIGDTIEKWYKDKDSEEMKELVVILNKVYNNLLQSDSKPINPPPEEDKEESKFQELTVFKGRNARVTKTFLYLGSKEDLTDIHQYLIDSDDENIDFFQQELVRNSGIYFGFLKMLEFDAEIDDHERESANKIIISKMYRILAKSIKGSDKNKSNLTKYLENIILVHYKDKSADLNSYFLLKQLVIDNKTILLDPRLINIVTETICDTINEWDNNDIRKSYSLSILSDMIKYRNYVLKTNQNIILSKIISKEFANINISFDTKEFEEEMIASGKTKNLKPFVKTIAGNRVIVLPANICYIIAYMNLLTTCTEEKNAFSENICQNLLNLDTLNKFILYQDLSIVLKHSILYFFFHVYLDTERDIPFHIIEIFLNILKFICEDFDFYARKLYLDNEESIESYEDFYILSYDSFRKFNSWIESYLIILIESFTNIIRRNLNLIPESKPARFYQEFLLNLINVAQQTYLKYKSPEIHSKLNTLLREIFINHQKDEIAEKITSKHRDKININGAKNDAESFDVSRRSSRRNTRLKSSKPGNQTMFSIIEYLIDLYFNSNTFKYRCKREFNGIIKYLNKIEDTTEELSEKINFDKFCNSLMKYLHPSNEEGEDSLRTLGLRILRNYIEKNAGIEDYRPLVDWDIDNWKDVIPILQSRQDKLVKLNMVNLICNVFINSDDLDVIKETLLLSIALLFGGNKNTQKVFFDFFRSNDDSVFLNKLKKVMFYAFDIVKKNTREKNTKIMKQFYSKFESKDSSGQQPSELVSISDIRAEVENVSSNYEISRYIFKFLQLLCEGHNEDLQNLLREQKDDNNLSSYKSINFISSTAGLWGSYIKFVNPDCYELGDFMLEFLVEAIQGPCVQNQLELYNSKIIDFSKDFMNDFSNLRDYESRGFTSDTSPFLDNLILQNIKMLYSLMEANQDESLYENIGSNISFDTLISKLVLQFKDIFKGVFKETGSKQVKNISSYASHLEKEVKKIKFFGEEIEEAFNIFFFIRTINDRTQVYKEKIKELTGFELMAYSFFEKHSAHIEIVFKGDIHKVYFVIQPSCRYLDENEQKTFIDEVKRETANEKITDFMLKAPRLFDIMDHMSNLRSKCAFASQNSFKMVRDFCLIIVFIINVYVFIFYKKEVRENKAYTVNIDYTPLVLAILGGLHLFFSCSMILLWLIVNGRLLIMDGWRKKFSFHRKNLPKLLESYKGMDTHTIILNFNKTLIDLTSTDRIKMLRFINEGIGQQFTIPSLEYMFQSLLYILSDSSFKYFAFYICLSVIAYSKQVVILYSIHLLDIINRFDTLGNVIRAVTHNKPQLLLTAFLAIIILYFYALFAFTYADDTFFTYSVEPAGESMCNTLLQCFTTVSSLGPRSSGSVGDVLLRPSYAQTNRFRYYIRWIYDVSIFYVVNIICMKLIFGIIIDTFAELRDKKSQIDYDKKNVCFICSLDRYVFDKNADGFENHIKRDHNVWNYLFFMYSLKKKDSTTFNGIESYVNERTQTDDISWIPIGSALCIRKHEEEKDNLDTKIAHIQRELEKIEGHLNILQD